MTSSFDTRPRAQNLEPRSLKVLPARGGAGPLAYQAEQYRVLGHIVEQLGKSGRTAIAISSPVGGDGKTTTSINLARTLAQAPKARILLVDADLRRGSVGVQLGIGRATSRGLAGAIADSACGLEAVVRRIPAMNLSVLPAGPCPPMPYEALRSPRTSELLREARECYDYVLVDTPPVVPVADVRALSQWVDGIFLVVTAHYTPRELVDEALSALDPEKVVGIVFNGDDQPLSRRYRYYYNYAAAPAPKPGFWASILGPRAGP
jgi:capsular exopolysaccharide synthesis family protein